MGDIRNRLGRMSQRADAGRGPIKRFHMFDCENAVGEFAGWNRADSDSAIYNFRRVILDADLRGYACAIEIAPWDELVIEPLRTIFGDAERYCVTTCIIRSNALALSLGEKELRFVFDNRPSRNEANKRIFDLFQGFQRLDDEFPQLDNIAFLGSAATLPLQGADLVANEYFRAVAQIIAGKPKLRAHWHRLEESGKFGGEMMLRPQIEAMVAKQMANAKTMPPHEFRLMMELLKGTL